MSNTSIKLEEVREFQRILRKVYRSGVLRRGGGICAEVCHHKENMLPTVALSFRIVRLLMEGQKEFSVGIEKPGIFGPRRKTFAAMLLSIPAEDLLEIIEAPRTLPDD